ncbi:head-tail joining protein [Citreimonas sp.]|uniref:head-tail joining protein n=1 Tax=Citreimonas sp. TaxID=3036715 RepID=UPI00405A16A3
MTVFETGLSALFADPNMGLDAVYTPQGGQPVSLRAIRSSADELTGFGDTRLHSNTAMFEVQVAAVAVPRAGDTISVGSETFVVQGEPERDVLGLAWLLDTVPA